MHFCKNFPFLLYKIIKFQKEVISIFIKNQKLQYKLKIKL